MATAVLDSEQILAATRAEEVFGELVGDGDEQLRLAKQTYHRLVRAVHPDRNPEDPLAHEATSYLSKLWEVAERSIRDGTYGTDRAPLVDVVRISSRRHAYVVSEMFDRDPVANYYRAGYTDDDGDHPTILKVARNPRDNDLMATEASMLKRLLSDPDTYDDIEPYLPGYIETFGYKGPKDKKPRQSSVFRYLPNYRFYSLEQVKHHYPHLNPKDMAWMFRRLLFGFGLIHSQGIVHGGILPCNLFIQPEDHGLIFGNWIYATETGKAIKVIDPRYQKWYPSEVTEKEKALPGTDIFMACRCMIYLLGDGPTIGSLPDDLPKPLRTFFRGCMLPLVRRRPQDGWDLLEEFNELIEAMWGPRRFRPFYM